MVISMPTMIKKDLKKFMKELKLHYDDVWRVPSSEYLKQPDFVVVALTFGSAIISTRSKMVLIISSSMSHHQEKLDKEIFNAFHNFMYIK